MIKKEIEVHAVLPITNWGWLEISINSEGDHV